MANWPLYTVYTSQISTQVKYTEYSWLRFFVVSSRFLRSFFLGPRCRNGCHIFCVLFENSLLSLLYVWERFSDIKIHLYFFAVMVHLYYWFYCWLKSEVEFEKRDKLITFMTNNLHSLLMDKVTCDFEISHPSHTIHFDLFGCIFKLNIMKTRNPQERLNFI